MTRDKSKNRKAQAILVTSFWAIVILFSFLCVQAAITTTTLRATTIYVTTIDEYTSGGYVNILKLVVEKGTSHPLSPTVGYTYFRTDWDKLTMYNGSVWLNMTSEGVSDHGSLTGLSDDDHTIYLLADGTRSLSANWNVGNYGLYAVSTINATTIYVSNIDELVSGSGVKILKLIVENGTSFPASPIENQVFLRTDHKVLYAYDGASWVCVGYRDYANLTGTPDLSVYVLTDGSRALTGNWNVGGSYGIYGAVWINCTNEYLQNLYWNAYITDPSTTGEPSGFMWYNSVEGKLKFWDGSTIQVLPSAVGNGTYKLTPSYTLYKSGSTYYAMDEDGNVDYSSTSANYVLGNSSNGDNRLIFLKCATYQISSLTISNKVHFVAEIGTIWNLTAKPSITINTETIFENIKFYTVIDGSQHIRVDNDVTFKNCTFDFQIDSQDVEGGLIRCYTADKKVKFIDCSITAGKDAAEYSCFFESEVNMDLLEVDGFTVESMKATGTTGRISGFIVFDSNITLLKINNLLIKNTAMDSPSQFVYCGVSGTGFTHKAMITNMIYESQYGGTSYLKTLSIRGNSTVVSNCISMVRDHPEFRCMNLAIDGWIIFGTTSARSAIDLAVSPWYGCRATVTRCLFDHAGIDTNSNYSDFAISNSIFRNGRITFLDESAPKGMQRQATISNCLWNTTGSTGYNYAILIGYGQELNLRSLQISNVRAYGLSDFLSVSGQSLYPSDIIVDNLYMEPKKDSQTPRFVNSNSARSSNMTYKISNSYIVSWRPPLGGYYSGAWYDYETTSNDRFLNVKWLRTNDDAVLYSEYGGTQANCVNGTTITHNLVLTPTKITFTLSGSNYINSTCFLLQPTVLATSSTTITLGFYGVNITTGQVFAVDATLQKDVIYTASVT